MNKELLENSLSEEEKIWRLIESQRYILNENVKKYLGIEQEYNAGIINFETFCTYKGIRNASVRMLNEFENNEFIDEDIYKSIITEETLKAAQPTQEEINAANIDYLLMLGGEK